MKIVEYQVVSDTRVQEWIAKGWQPWGSPMMKANFPQQAMVKYEEEPEQPLIPAPGSQITFTDDVYVEGGAYSINQLPIIENPPVTLDRGN